MKFGEEFKFLRNDLGLSQQALADITKIPRRTIEDWETFRREPPEYVQILILEKLRGMLKKQ